MININNVIEHWPDIGYAIRQSDLLLLLWVIGVAFDNACTWSTSDEFESFGLIFHWYIEPNRDSLLSTSRLDDRLAKNECTNQLSALFILVNESLLIGHGTREPDNSLISANINRKWSSLNHAFRSAC